ncbi:MAG TPA: Hpt domain-containing protein [Devosia sp.]|nr:Hpt domain-containing protein [Devosia sp.]
MAAESAMRIQPEGAPSKRGAGPIDMIHLSGQTLGDENLGLEVLRLFDEMSKTYFARIETSTTVPDLLQHLHTLRGAALGVGAFALAELARTAETELTDGKPVNPERIDDIEIAVREVSEFIAETLANAA